MLRLLTVNLAAQHPLEDYYLPKLRGAIAEKAGLEHDEFHNHNNAEGAAVAFLYKYPRIQYRMQQGELKLICLEEGVDALQHFFAQPDWTLNLDNGETLNLRISDLKLHEAQPEVTDTSQGYQLRNWYALNQENYIIYQNLQTDDSRRSFLETLIANQIVLFLREFDCLSVTPIVVNIDRFYTNMVLHKRKKIKTFDIHFRANVRLPHQIGLGKAAAMGFGALIGAFAPKIGTRI